MDAKQNAFVDIHGRIIATFDQLNISDEEYWLLIEAPFVEATVNHLSRYAKISGVKLEIKAESVYFDLDKREYIVTADAITTDVTEDEFTLFRVKNNIPRQGVDYTNDFLLNVSTTNLVSFTKGCYLGQEPISKVYNRSKPTWKLIVRTEDECSPEEKAKMTSKVVDPATHRPMGFVFVKNQ